MKRLIAVSMAFGLCTASVSVAAGPQSHSGDKPEPAAPWEMTDYVFGFLRRGDGRPADVTAEESRRLQEAHLAHIQSMADSGKLVAAGPFGDDGPLRGILVFQQAAPDEARALAEADPKVRARWLTVDLHPWRGPAGIGARYAAMVERNPEAEANMVECFLAITRRGPSWPDAPSAETQRLMSAHIGFLNEAARAGTLAAAGPFMEEGELTGLFLFRATSLEEARALSAKDPLIEAGHMHAEIHPLWIAQEVLP